MTKGSSSSALLWYNAMVQGFEAYLCSDAHCLRPFIRIHCKTSLSQSVLHLPLHLHLTNITYHTSLCVYVISYVVFICMACVLFVFVRRCRVTKYF